MSIFNEFTPLCKFTFLKGYAFRNSNPAVFGIKVDVGKLRQKTNFMNKTGKKIGYFDGQCLDKCEWLAHQLLETQLKYTGCHEHWME